MSATNIPELMGRTFATVAAKEGEEEMLFTDASGRWVKFYYEQDCCASCSISDIVGDLSDLIDSPLVVAEEVSSEDEPPKAGEYGAPESFTWTFYRFGTVKGSVTVRWFGESDGHYSEEVTMVTSEKPSPW